MSSVSVTIAANEYFMLPAGNVFFLDACEYLVTVEIIKDGRVVGKKQNAEGGMFWEGKAQPGGSPAFDSVRITAGSNTTKIRADVSMLGVGRNIERALGQQIEQSVVSVTTTATLLASHNFDRKGLTFRNEGGQSVFLGGSNVTTADGFELKNGESFTVEHGEQAAWYAIVPATTDDIEVLESVIN